MGKRVPNSSNQRDTVTVPASAVTVGNELDGNASQVTNVEACKTQATHVHIRFARGWSWCIHKSTPVERYVS